MSLALQLGQGVVAAVFRRGDVARDAVGELMRGLGAQLMKLDWSVLCAAYPNCPKPEKNLLQGALRCVHAQRGTGMEGGGVTLFVHLHRERAETEAADSKGAQDFVALLGR